MHIIVILLFVSMHYLCASVFDRGSEDAFVWLLGECARGKLPFEIQKKSFYKHAIQEAEKILANELDVENAEKKVAEYAQWFLNTYKNQLAPWCQDLSAIGDFVKRKLPNAKPKQASFCRIALLLALGDVKWRAHPECIFLQNSEPEDLSVRLSDILGHYFKEGQDYMFIVSEDPRTSYLVELLAMSKGKKVINLAINCWDRPQDFCRRRGYRGLLSGLRHTCISGTNDLEDILDAHHEGLSAIMRSQVMQVIDKNWEECGVQYVMAAHHIFCDIRLKVFLSLEADLMEHWVIQFLLITKISAFGSKIIDLARNFYCANPVASVHQWDASFWKELLPNLPRLNTRYRQLSVFGDVYKSWFPQEHPIYGIEGYQKIAKEAIRYICDHIDGVSDQERGLLLGFAHQDLH